MLRLAIQILLISTVFGLTGCFSYRISNATVIPDSVDIYNNVYFSDKKYDYVYKANVEAYGNNLGGIVVIKKIADSSHRVVFTTDFGNKLLDFSISQGEFKVNFVVDGLNNRRLLGILESDFRLLLNEVFEIDQTLIADNVIIYKSSQKRGANYLYLTENGKKLFRIVNTSGTKERITFDFQNKSDIFAESIEITHHNLPFKMKLTEI